MRRHEGEVELLKEAARRREAYQMSRLYNTYDQNDVEEEEFDDVKDIRAAALRERKRSERERNRITLERVESRREKTSR